MSFDAPICKIDSAKDLKTDFGILCRIPFSKHNERETNCFCCLLSKFFNNIFYLKILFT